MKYENWKQKILVLAHLKINADRMMQLPCEKVYLLLTSSAETNEQLGCFRVKLIKHEFTGVDFFKWDPLTRFNQPDQILIKIHPLMVVP